MKCIYITVLTFALSTSLNAQTLVKNKTDEFTGAHLKTTCWETLCRSGFSNPLNIYFRFRQIDNDMLMDMKIMAGGVFSINKGDDVMFILDNGNVVSAQCNEYELTTFGGGAIGLSGSEVMGLEATYRISPELFTKLSSHSVKRVRIYMSDGYLDKSVTKGHALWFINSINLLK